jgi:hypothetical protein
MDLEDSRLTALHIAQVRVTFTAALLPKVLLVQNPAPPAYIEWFATFHSCEPASDIIYVRRLAFNRMHSHFAEIIPAKHIARSRHLAPDFRKEKDSRMLQEDGSECGFSVDRFFVNPYIACHTFCPMKLRCRNCV